MSEASAIRLRFKPEQTKSIEPFMLPHETLHNFILRLFETVKNNPNILDGDYKNNAEPSSKNSVDRSEDIIDRLEIIISNVAINNDGLKMMLLAAAKDNPTIEDILQKLQTIEE